MISTPLQYFLKIAELGSLTAAARALRVSQPSLSVALKRLEEQLDTTLFVRTRRGVTLTRTGEVLLRETRQAARALAAARDEIHGLETEPRGEFTLGVHESLGAYCLPGFMARFLGEHPGIQLSLWNGNSREVQRAVVEREIDLGLVVNAEPHPDCVIQELFRDRVELVAAKELAGTKRKAAATASIVRAHPLLYVPALRQVQYILGALAHDDVRPARHLSCSSMELVKSLVLEGVGVGILPFRVATYRVPAGRLVPLAGPNFEDTISLVRRYDLHDTRAVHLLLDSLRAHSRTLGHLP